MLYANGEAVAVGSRAIDVLVALLRRQGRLVSKAELLEEAWSGLVVEENNLQVQISALRKVLGADAIATVPGRGYRFMVPIVSAVAPAQDTQADLRAAAGPVRAAPAVRLPLAGGTLWGRDTDMMAIEALHGASLVTITGPAGVGKTAFAVRLARAWSAECRDGAVWVDLAAVTEPAAVCRALAQAVNVPQADGDTTQALVTALRGLQLLVVLDNAEHVVEPVAELLTTLLQTAAGLRVLTTSQCPLRVAGERLFTLGPLSVPDPGASLDDAMRHGAFALFVDQVRAMDRRFQLTDAHVALIADLCRRLDGLPLAIKLAASRVPLLGLQGVAARLDERFRLLAAPGHSVPLRQQTLAAALDWSHELLSGAEQAVFRRLSVFVGGFSVDMARALAREPGDDAWDTIERLASLVDRSLVAVDDTDPPRYRLLDTMRAYAWARLEQAGEAAAMRARHAALMADTLDAAYRAYWETPDAAWLQQHGADIDNVRLALDWCTQVDPMLGLRLLGAASPLFMLLGLAPECRWRGQMLEPHAVALTPGAAVSRFWLERSRLHWGVSNHQMHQFALHAAASYRAADDAMGLFLALRCLAGSGALNPAQARAAVEEMLQLERPDWPARLRAQRLMAQVTVYRADGLLLEARHACEDLIMLTGAHGLDGMRSAARHDLACICLTMNDEPAAWLACQHILDEGRSRRDNFVLHALALQAVIRLRARDWRAARGLLQDFLTMSKSRGWEWLDLYSGVLAWLAAAEGRAEDAARLLGHAKRSRGHLGPLDPLILRVDQVAHDLVYAALPAPVMSRLMSQGASLMPETVVAWALAAPAMQP
ncbi:AAA family ATPase [Aquabacterium fontiphilum]|jgi:predicted ATPase/DNA-binding winged helix-turn-helix (wHTH) protein|uniref:ATP-binding protein n=1 Tax=Aquabacterium fontiphilum TaxID=450365 RepID=UPI0013773B06|nr:winged helix-turn-helix domain-containing protein [Aquabacterium fontiphilum]NBD20522.1 AAA family ATPase [Aquabacterium fontiphilum]